MRGWRHVAALARAPPFRRSGPLDEAEVAQLAAALGVERAAVQAQTWADNGPGWRVVELASAAQWLLSREPMPAQWTASQGTALGREGRVEITVEQNETVWIGGDTVLTIEGTILA